ncbi:MAG: 50S ribosomal protein L19 [Legionellales bacterium]|nr:50S ribosomal protein L19 [Legionellales bacterium]
MKHPTIEAITKKHIDSVNHPDIHTGDTVVVSMNVTEGNRKRVQKYRGVIIAMRNRGIASSITVRKVSGDHATERVLPLYSKQIAKIEVERLGDVRRAKILEQRHLRGRKARIKQKLPKKTAKVSQPSDK